LRGTEKRPFFRVAALPRPSFADGSDRQHYLLRSRSAFAVSGAAPEHMRAECGAAFAVTRK
jgi:hypothetical protein